MGQINCVMAAVSTSRNTSLEQAVHFSYVQSTNVSIASHLCSLYLNVHSLLMLHCVNVKSVVCTRSVANCAKFAEQRPQLCYLIKPKATAHEILQLAVHKHYASDTRLRRTDYMLLYHDQQPVIHIPGDQGTIYTGEISEICLEILFQTCFAYLSSSQI